MQHQFYEQYCCFIGLVCQCEVCMKKILLLHKSNYIHEWDQKSHIKCKIEFNTLKQYCSFIYYLFASYISSAPLCNRIWKRISSRGRLNNRPTGKNKRMMTKSSISLTLRLLCICLYIYIFMYLFIRNNFILYLVWFYI